MLEKYGRLNINDKLLLGAIIYEYWNEGKIINGGKSFMPEEIGFVNSYEVLYYLYIMSNYITGEKIVKGSDLIIQNVKMEKEVKELFDEFKSSAYEEKLRFISYFSKEFYCSKEFDKISLFKNLTEEYSFLDISKSIDKYLMSLN